MSIKAPLVILYDLICAPRRHLLGTGREREAVAVVAELNGLPEDDPAVQEAIEELEFGIKAENEGGKVTWMECFSKRNMLWKRTINGMMLQFIQQLNGQNFYCESPRARSGLVHDATPFQSTMAILSSRYVMNLILLPLHADLVLF